MQTANQNTQHSFKPPTLKKGLSRQSVPPLQENLRARNKVLPPLHVTPQEHVYSCLRHSGPKHKRPALCRQPLRAHWIMEEGRRPGQFGLVWETRSPVCVAAIQGDHREGRVPGSHEKWWVVSRDSRCYKLLHNTNMPCQRIGMDQNMTLFKQKIRVFTSVRCIM